MPVGVIDCILLWETTVKKWAARFEHDPFVAKIQVAQKPHYN